MYYETAIIQGVMCWRETPDGNWIKFSQQDLTKKTVNLKQTLCWAQDALRHVDEHISTGAELDHAKIKDALMMIYGLELEA